MTSWPHSPTDCSLRTYSHFMPPTFGVVVVVVVVVLQREGGTFGLESLFGIQKDFMEQSVALNLPSTPQLLFQELMIQM